MWLKSTVCIVTVRYCVPRRERTKLVYSMYSRMSGETVKRNLMKLGVDFFVLEDSWCTRRTRYLNTISGLSHCYLRPLFSFTFWVFSWCFLKTRRFLFSSNTEQIVYSWLTFFSSLFFSSSFFPPLCFPPGRVAACQRSGTLRIPKILVKLPSAPTCPGTHDPTSPQSSPMTFTKFSKSPKLPKISDNIVGQTGSAPNLFFPLLLCFIF